MNYRRGFKRLYVVVVVLWALLLIVAFARNAIAEVELLVGLVIPPVFGYILFFVAIPWIVNGFK